MRLIFSSVIVLLAIFQLFTGSSYAQSNVKLEGSVGKYYFSASGIVSPFASVVMTSQDFFLSSTVADSEGRFILPEALVNDGFNNFCLEAVDIRRLGTSYTCFDTQPPERDYSKDEIFLPPTVGLSGRKIEPNSSITASGYSMPGSDVEVKLGEDFWIEAKANQDGFYKTEVKNEVPPGKYQLYATAVYGVQISEKPTRTFEIEVLGLIALIPVWLWISLLVLLIILFFILFIILARKRRKKNKESKKKKR